MGVLIMKFAGLFLIFVGVVAAYRGNESAWFYFTVIGLLFLGLLFLVESKGDFA